ncbi:putative nucleotidyltransferase, ribonuclease H, partial [Tanacetum coccineum]
MVKNEIVKLLDSGLNYPILDSPWVSPIHVVPKKGGMTMVLNDNNKLIPSHTVTGWRFFQIPITPEDQEKKTVTCPYGTFAYRRMPFGLCNAPATFQRCMTEIFHDMVEDFMEVFMDDLSVFGNSFDRCLDNLDKMLARCEETNLVLNWEKCHFMVKEGIVLGHKISGKGVKVDKAKIDVIAKLPYPTNVKGVRSFLGHTGFYRRFIKDFSMISKPMTQLLMKDAKFDFSEGLGAVLGQRVDGKFKPIYYARKILNDVQAHYTTTKKEFLAVDAKPRLIRWVLLLQGFNIEIKDRKRAENLALITCRDSRISRGRNTNKFLDEHFMILKAKFDDDEP